MSKAISTATNSMDVHWQISARNTLSLKGFWSLEQLNAALISSKYLMSCAKSMSFKLKRWCRNIVVHKQNISRQNLQKIVVAALTKLMSCMTSVLTVFSSKMFEQWSIGSSKSLVETWATRIHPLSITVWPFSTVDTANSKRPIATKYQVRINKNRTWIKVWKSFKSRYTSRWTKPIQSCWQLSNHRTKSSPFPVGNGQPTWTTLINGWATLSSKMADLNTKIWQLLASLS